jgi:hypothetical protein
MIILKEIERYDKELQSILNLAIVDLQNRFNQDKKLLRSYGSAFEREVCNTLNAVSSGFGFHEKFEQASVHAFPDLYEKIMEKK